MIKIAEMQLPDKFLRAARNPEMENIPKTRWMGCRVVPPRFPLADPQKEFHIAFDYEYLL
jgi:hypothetical protein